MNREPLRDATFRKASGSGDIGCVEVASVQDTVGVRDSRDLSGPILAFSDHEWTTLVQRIKNGHLDLHT
jgi:hypothetical protein